VVRPGLSLQPSERLCQPCEQAAEANFAIGGDETNAAFDWIGYGAVLNVITKIRHIARPESPNGVRVATLEHEGEFRATVAVLR
jgi:hypothetical protein